MGGGWAQGYCWTVNYSVKEKVNQGMIRGKSCEVRVSSENALSKFLKLKCLLASFPFSNGLGMRLLSSRGKEFSNLEMDSYKDC